MGHGGHGTENGNEAPEAFLQQSEDESKTQPLLTPLQLGPFKLNHRVVMAPLTRCRSYGCVPQKHAAVYYAQRTTPGGLIIAEATSVAGDGNGYPHTPGIWTQEQVEAWKPIVQAVHNKGGVFICQLWHVGRVSHTAYHNGAAPPSSTAQRVTQGQITLPNAEGQADFSTPRALATSEIPKYINHFRVAARNAIEAGFDGVELHGAHGYFIDQFLKDRINDRTDKYGGSLSNRCRFLEEVLTAVTDEVGPQRVGIRISPFTHVWNASDSDPNALAHHIVTHVLSKFDLLYLHVVEPRFQFTGEVETEDSLWPIRRAYRGKIIAAGGFDQELGNDSVKSGRVDAVVYGREFLANPDLVKRFALRAPLNEYHRETFYTQDPVVGYTDYPFLEEEEEARQ